MSMNDWSRMKFGEKFSKKRKSDINKEVIRDLEETKRKMKEKIVHSKKKEDKKWSIILSTILLKENSDYKGKEADEMFQFGTQAFTSKEFRKYVLRKIQLGLTDPNLIVDESDYK